MQATREHPGLQPFDDEMVAFMRDRDIPGGALAVSRNGRLVLARGYGYADRDAGELVQPASLFRIASLSKPITGVAVLHAVGDSAGRATLDTPILDILDEEPYLPEGATFDERWRETTIRQVLHHQGGWDRGASFDPMFQSVRFAEQLGEDPPAGPGAIIRIMLGHRLDFDPGTKDVYSNLGYCLLGRVIEELSGQTYEGYVQQELLAGLGINGMRIGHSLPDGRTEGEVRYYDPGDGDNVFTPEDGDLVPRPYGSFYLEAMDAHGGWLASAPALVRFACALDDPEDSPLLSERQIEELFARPEGPSGNEEDRAPQAADDASWWLVRPTADGKANHWHTGSLPGTSTLLVRRYDGLNWAVLLNQREDPSGLSYGEMDPMIHRAANAVTDWPEDDLFPLLEGQL